jgi:hypothetical protein
MDSITKTYVKLALQIGQYDSHHGPEDWKPAELSEEEKQNFPLERFRS